MTILTYLLTFQRAMNEVCMLWFKNKFPYISVIDEASDFKFDMQLGFAKAHHQILLEEKVVVALG